VWVSGVPPILEKTGLVALIFLARESATHFSLALLSEISIRMGAFALPKREGAKRRTRRRAIRMLVSEKKRREFFKI